ncbi:MAG: GNAT family N-acetyltransferase [Acidimicrobiales bacterium]
MKPLDDWLRSHALENQRRDLSRTFVLLDDAGVVIGYYALTMGGVMKDELPPRLGRGLPGYQLGLVLLARLAVDGARQGEGLGRDLLVDAIVQASAAGQHAAARFIAVDPIDDSARSFYGRFGFLEIRGDEHGRMFIRIDDARASIQTAHDDN